MKCSQLALLAASALAIGCGGSSSGGSGPTQTFTSVNLTSSSTEAFEFGVPDTLKVQPLDQTGADMTLSGATTTFNSDPAGKITVANGGIVTVLAGQTGTVNVTASVTGQGKTVQSNPVTLTLDVAASSVNVTTSGFTFVPSVVHIKSGGTINWSNLQGGGHNVDFVNAMPFSGHSASGTPGSLDHVSANFSGAAGTQYLYHCDVHGSGDPGPPPTVSGMSGSVTVH